MCFRRALKQELTGADLNARAGEHQIPLEMERSIMLFQIEQTEKASAYSILGELIPLTDTDTLIEMNRHIVALVKDMNGIDGPEELYQFAQAVQETLMEEAVQTAEIGIGGKQADACAAGRKLSGSQACHGGRAHLLTGGGASMCSTTYCWSASL